MALVTNNLHRFKFLDLDIPRDEDAYPFFKMFSRSAPLLWHMKILNLGHQTFAFPDNFLGGNAPKLRHLSLSTGSRIPWDSGLFTNLVTLEVNTFGERGSGLSLEKLLSALARMLGLEILTLRRCLPPPPPSTVAPSRVNLLNLGRLELVGPLNHCTSFLNRIVVNSGTAVLLDLECSGTPKEDIDAFFAVFPSQLCTISPPIAQTLEFTLQNTSHFKVDAWEVTNIRDVNITLVFRWEAVRLWAISPLDLTWACFSAIGSPELCSFRFSDDSVIGWDVGIWRRAARMAPELQRLAVGCPAQSFELCKALCPPDGQDLVPGDCYLPALSYLELVASHDEFISPLGGRTAQLSGVLSHSLAAREIIGCSTPEVIYVVSSAENYPQ
ncbi:hypothetical protein BD779DRAFT_1680866 [Infundibulicybe gibba]|nr:hypothetical protein BD779DRAFT_1680866 [Infundibulicybe gibba]